MRRFQAGFTLVELLLSVGIMGMLTGIVISALTPASQLAASRNAQRRLVQRDLGNVIQQYIIDTEGVYPGDKAIPAGANAALPICRATVHHSSCINLDVLVTEGYLSALPVDIAESNNLLTGYKVFADGPQVQAISQYVGMPPAAVCGNGNVEAGEQCDDGNATNTDPCKNSCQLNTCGDGVPGGPGEGCDDGNQINNDGCTQLCKKIIIVIPI